MKAEEDIIEGRDSRYEINGNRNLDKKTQDRKKWTGIVWQSKDHDTGCRDWAFFSFSLFCSVQSPAKDPVLCSPLSDDVHKLCTSYYYIVHNNIIRGYRFVSP